MKGNQKEKVVNAGFGLALVILIVIGVLSYMNVTNMNEFDRMEANSYDVMFELEGVIAAMKDLEIGELTFVLTGEEKLMRSYRTALAQLDRNLTKLKILTWNKPEQQSRVLRVELMIMEKLAEIDKTVAIRKTEGFSAAYRNEFSDQHERLAEEINSQLIETNDYIRHYLKSQEDLKDASAGKIVVASLVGNILGFAMLITSFFLLKREVIKRRRTEEEIKMLNRNLEEHTVELEAANKELEAFNYTVSHDLRQPLNVTNSYCQAIKELCGDMLTEQCMGYLQETYNSIMRMNRLIDALLKFSSLSSVKLCWETVDLCALAQEVVLELMLTDPGRRVTFRIADGAISTDGDTNLLRVVVDNLFGNAWKYTGAREEALIEFGVMEVDGRRACFVRDNGSGFNMADADKLFTPFRRLPGAEECRGFGIGLATVERIIRLHGGRVWAEGEPGRGATFYFTV